MTLLGVFGIMLGFLSITWAWQRTDNFRLGLFLVMAMAHIASSYIYFDFVQTNDADTKLYYFDDFGFRFADFELGTIFVIQFTQAIRDWVGGTYLDHFFLYQAAGVWGLAFVTRTLDELCSTLNVSLPPLMVALLFLPGMYFWTSAIGKDPPLFLACAMAVWACTHISRRWIWFGIAIGIMILFRAHVALVTIASLAVALIAGRGVPTGARILLGAAALASGVMLFGTLQTLLRVDLSSVTSIANFVETQTGAATQGVDNTLANASFPVKLTSLLYRPLFFDAEGLFGLVASAQNLLMLYITFELARNIRLILELFKESLLFRFALVHATALYLMLAFMYYNLGLGLRQREMATPALLLVFGAVHIVSRSRRGRADDVVAGAGGVPMAAMRG